MQNATDMNCWTSAALTSQRLGDYEGAANILGTIIKSFPALKNASLVSISVSAILAELNQFEQAIAYMHNAMVKGATQPLSNIHLMFFMSRLYERWHNAYVESPEKVDPPPVNALTQAKAGFARIFEFEAESGGIMFNAEWAGLGAPGWVTSSSVWKSFGDAASSAFQFVLAADLYREGLRRDPPKPLRPGPFAYCSRAYVRAGKNAEATEMIRPLVWSFWQEGTS